MNSFSEKVDFIWGVADIAIRGYVRSAAIVPGDLADANLTQDTARLAPCSTMTSRWLWYLTMSLWFSEYVTPRIVGFTVTGINIWELARIPLPDAPLQEQVAIAAALDERLYPLDAAGNGTLASIVRLPEYRPALITAAVTGQLNIEGAA